MTHPSVPQLDQTLERYFARRRWTKPEIVVNSEGPLGSASKVTDVWLLAGDVIRFLDAKQWRASSSFRLWTPSSPLAELLCSLGLAPEMVGRVDRYRLIPRRRPRYTLGQIESFVIAERDIPDKNTDRSIAFAQAYMRLRLKRRIPIYVCGPGRLQMPNRDGVVFLGDLGERWARNSLFKKAAFLGLSTLHHEDFGISVAQAQNAAMPVVVSQWFGHRDVTGDEVYKIPLDVVLNSGSTERRLVAAMARESVKIARQSDVRPIVLRGREIREVIARIPSKQKAELSVFFDPLTRVSRIKTCPGLAGILAGH